MCVQLLSLHGKAEVLVERLQLTVIEDHGGTGLSRYMARSLFSLALSQLYSALYMYFGCVAYKRCMVLLSPFSKPEARGVESQSDVQHLLDSLPSHNLPPFLTNLLTSLQHLQAHVSPATMLLHSLYC